MRRTNFLIKFILLCLNLTAVLLAFILSYFLKFSKFDLAGFQNQNYDVLLIISFLVCVIISIRDRVFTELSKVKLMNIFFSAFKDSLTIILSLFFFIVALKGYQYSRQFHILFTMLLFVFFVTFRLALLGFISSYIKKKVNSKKIMIVATLVSTDQIVRRIKVQEKLTNAVFYLVDESKFNIIENVSFLPIEYLERSLNDGVYEVILFYNDQFRDAFEKIIQLIESKGIRVRIVPNYSLIGSTDLVLEKDFGLPLLRNRPEPLEDVNNYLLKRVFDILFSAIFLITMFPVIYLIVALLIKLSSRGPIFFKQLRTGQLNREFYCLKFRSMKVNPDSDLVQATEFDPRKTKLGNFLRKTNIDELPQFINVLRGDMSVVGPRPHMIRHTEEYSQKIDTYKVRHFCKPGITGWAQVNGFRGETRDSELMRKRVEHDIWYIENWSFWLDIKIIFRTIINIFKGQKEAY
jgi:Undecaprenyl-phosphate glucose phosphotransferase